jgi:hypothetical protein
MAIAGHSVRGRGSLHPWRNSGATRYDARPRSKSGVLIPAVLMVGAADLIFLELRRGRRIVRRKMPLPSPKDDPPHEGQSERKMLSAVASVLWLTIVLGLGSLDPLTQARYHVKSSKSWEGRHSPALGTAFCARSYMPQAMGRARHSLIQSAGTHLP